MVLVKKYLTLQRKKGKLIVHWDGRRLVGHMDFGNTSIDNDSAPLAKISNCLLSRVLLLYLENFICVFFNDGINSASNLSIAKKLGCLLDDIDNLVTTLKYEDKEV